MLETTSAAKKRKRRKRSLQKVTFLFVGKKEEEEATKATLVSSRICLTTRARNVERGRSKKGLFSTFGGFPRQRRIGGRQSKEWLIAKKPD